MRSFSKTLGVILVFHLVLLPEVNSQFHHRASVQFGTYNGLGYQFGYEFKPLKLRTGVVSGFYLRPYNKSYDNYQPTFIIPMALEVSIAPWPAKKSNIEPVLGGRIGQNLYWLKTRLFDSYTQEYVESSRFTWNRYPMDAFVGIRGKGKRKFEFRLRISVIEIRDRSGLIRVDIKPSVEFCVELFRHSKKDAVLQE